MFNALGKSRIPLYFLIFFSVFNIVLDWVFVADFALDVAGVAWATLIAQGVSVLGSFTVLRKELKKLEGASDGIFEAEELLSMAKIALPSILQQSTVSIVNLVNLSIRVIMAMTLAPRFGIAWVWYAVPIGWTANFVISYLEYRTGKWKTIRR